MCNCSTEVQKRLLDSFIKQAPEATGHEAELQGYGLVVVGNKMVVRGFMPVEVSANYRLKKGGTKYKVQKGNMMFFTFCPFCGEKYETAPEAQPAEVAL